MHVSAWRPTFADALVIVETLDGISEEQRRRYASALRCIGRMLKLPLAEIYCDPAWLNEHLAGIVPAAHGIGKGYLCTLRSSLRGVLRRLGCHAPKTCGAAPLPPAWAGIIGVVRNPGQRHSLARFGLSCAGQGAAPEEVTDEHLARYVAEENATRLSDGAMGRARKLANSWNACVRRGLPGWPTQLLKAPRRGPEPYALPLDAYPASFAEDVQRFQASLARRGSFSRRTTRGRRKRRIAPSTVEMRLFAIRQVAGLLVQSGVPGEEIRSLRDLVQPLERVEYVLDTIEERQVERGGKERAQGSQLATVAETLRQTGHHVGLDDDSIAQLTEWRKDAYGRRRQGLTPKNRERLRALIQLPARAILLHLPAELWRRAKALGPGTVAAARLMRLAVALEILLVCPIRRHSLLALRFDQHLQRLDPRSRRITHLVLRVEDTKNEEPLEWPLPSSAAKMIEVYRRDYRPALDPKGTNPFLLPGSRGQFHAGRFAATLKGTIERETGVKVNPHLLRHFAAWLHLKKHPGAYEDVRRMLGHRSLQTTIDYYVGLEVPAAAERFDATVLGERQATRGLVGSLRRARSRSGRSTRNSR
jgi:integrase